MCPKIVDKDCRRAEIAAAALEVIAERGFEASSISQIAAAAGISKGTVYLYFDSRAELLVAAARTWVAAIEAGVAPPVHEGADPLSRLRTLLAASTRAFLDDPRMVRLFLGVAQLSMKDPEALGGFDVVREVSAPIRTAVQRILLDGVEAGVFRPEVAADAERLAINLVAFVDGIGLHHLSSPDHVDLAGQIDLHLRGLMASLEQP
jgi:AcrR family transcriptional regulator